MPKRYVNVKPIMQPPPQAQKSTFHCLHNSQSCCLGPSTGCPQLMCFIPCISVTQDSCQVHNWEWLYDLVHASAQSFNSRPGALRAYTTSRTQFKSQQLYKTFFCFHGLHLFFPTLSSMVFCIYCSIVAVI